MWHFLWIRLGHTTFDLYLNHFFYFLFKPSDSPKEEFLPSPDELLDSEELSPVKESKNFQYLLRLGMEKLNQSWKQNLENVVWTLTRKTERLIIKKVDVTHRQCEAIDFMYFE